MKKAAINRGAWNTGLMLALFICFPAQSADLSYAGRLVDDAGAPLAGPAAIKLRFFGSATGSDQLGPIKTFDGVPLEGGVFQLTVSLDATDEAAIFGDGTALVFVEIEAAGKLYPRQRFTPVPLALRIPVDSASLVYGTDAKLTVGEIAIAQVQGLEAALAQKADSTQASASASGYLSPSDWTAFNAKQDAITASSSVTAGSIATEAQDAIVIKPYGSQAGETGELRFAEKTGGNYVGFKAADTLAGNLVWTLPDADGASGQFLRTDGAGALSWDSPAGAGDMVASANLSDLVDASSARTNLGLGTLATLSAIASAEITNDSIVNADVAGAAAIATSKLSGAVTSIAGHGLGSLATSSSVTSADISDATIVNVDISAAAAIATSKLSGAVTSIAGHGLGSLATRSSVTAAEITDGEIADADISASAAIATSKLSGPLTAVSGHGLGSLAALSAVSSTEITDGTIADADLSGTAAIATSKLSGALTAVSGHGLGTLAALSTVSAAEITDGAIANADISATAAIDSSKIANGSVDSTEFQYLDGVTSSIQTQLDAKASAASPTFTGAIASALGSAAAPSYSFTGDSNTGIWSSGADTVNVSTGSSERLRVTSAGNVGIGTTAPAGLLDVNGKLTVLSGGNVGIGATTPAGKLHVASAGGVNSAGMVLSSSDTSVSFNVGDKLGTTASGWLTIDPNGSGSSGVGIYDGLVVGGNVGIGTTNPTASLHVRGTTGWPVTVEASESSTLISSIAGPVIANTDQTANNWVGIHFKDSASGPGSGAIGLQVTDHANDYGDVAIATRSASGFSEKFRVTSAGNVGIGTTAPAMNLDVAGSSATSNGVGVRIFNSNASNTNAWLLGTGGGVVPASSFSIGDASAYRLVINSSGKVGIGTTTPSNLLDVRTAAGLPGPSLSASNEAAYFSTTAGGCALGVGIGLDEASGAAYLQGKNRCNVGVSHPLALNPVGGNVGIGTTSPAALLHVAGAASVQSSSEGAATAVNSSTAYTIPDTSVNVRQITLTGNATITLPAYTAPSNSVYTLTVFLTQDATGSRTVTWAGNGSDTILWDTGTTPVISGTANYLTIIQFTKLAGTTKWYASMVWRQN